MTHPVRTELALILRSRLSLVSLVLLLVVAVLSVAAGLHAVSSQSAAIERSVRAQQHEQAQVASRYAGEQGDAGYVGYYTFHPTWDPPAPLAFVALGQRDVQPFLLRVRLLGLQSQLYEADAANPEMALPGSFDFMFVLVYLMPLVAIALMHDLVSGEREAGRLGLLRATATRPTRMWWRRVLLRYGLVLAALAVPLAAGCLLSGVPLAQMAVVGVVASLYAAFWFGAFALVASRERSSAVGAMSMFALWLALTLLLPTLANIAIDRAVPAGRGVDMMLAQRQQVHAGWDEPKDATFERFFRTHPQWRGTPPVTGRFHWKWFYAMHQAGDDAVAQDVADYRHSLRTRQRWAERTGWLLPGIAAQVAVQRLANTDLESQLRYQDRITAFHTSLRHYFYPYLFREIPFRAADAERMPRYAAGPLQGSVHAAALLALLLAAAIATMAGGFALRRTT